MNYVLLLKPLSKNFQDKLEAEYPMPLNYIFISEWRKLTYLALWRAIRKIRADKIIVPFEYPELQVFMPVLEILISLMRAAKIYLVNANLEIVEFARKNILVLLGKISLSTTKYYLFYWRCWWDLWRLKCAEKNQLELKLEQTKLLYLNANLWYGVKVGGSVGHIAGVVNALRQKSWEVDYWAVAANPCLSAQINYCKLSSPAIFVQPYELNYLYFNYLANKQIYNQNYGAIYQRISLENFSGAVLAKKFKLPLIVEYNGSEVWVGENWGAKLRYKKLALECEKVLLQRADLVVTISQVLAEELVSRGVSKDKIICYPNCIDPLIFNPAKYSLADSKLLRSKYELQEEDLVFTFLGTFGAWHGIEILAQAIRELVLNYRSELDRLKIKFLLVGYGERMESVRNILAAPECQAYIRFSGLVAQDQAPSYLAASDVLLSPNVKNQDASRFFGSPTKLFEYMAMGKAIIASDLEQLAEVLAPSLKVATLSDHLPTSANKELAVLAQPGEVTDLIKAILFLAAHPEWRLKLGANVRQEALAKYTWQHHVAAILSKMGWNG